MLNSLSDCRTLLVQEGRDNQWQPTHSPQFPRGLPTAILHRWPIWTWPLSFRPMQRTGGAGVSGFRHMGYISAPQGGARLVYPTCVAFQERRSPVSLSLLLTHSLPCVLCSCHIGTQRHLTQLVSSTKTM
jgi:hypothetical protein